MFQDLGSSPATLEAARACDADGCIPGHATEIADAEQAYIQAELKGGPSWVCLPEEARTAEVIGEKMAREMAGMRWPVVQLQKALYGHPDSGTFWEQHCDAHTKKVGFQPVGPEWPSC